jgi:ankyrin repeat protein
MNEKLFDAVARNYIKKVKSLIENGVCINSRDDYRNTPLFVAADYGHVILIVNFQ